jgi:uncharacterized RDD family membrane protein YckC
MYSKGTVIDSAINVVTPENIAFRYELAGPWRRLPAFVIDVIIRLAVIFGLSLLLTVIGIVAFFGLVIPILNLTWFVLEWFYGGLFETYWNGQTPGKRLLGLRVLTVDGRPINGLQAVMRNILRAVDLMPLLPLTIFSPEAPPAGVIPTFMVGLATMTLSARFQRMGDIVCGTMVVVEERSWLFGVSKIDDSRAEQLAEYIPPNFQINRQLGRAVATYVERRKFFAGPRRHEIARHIAQPLIERFRLPRDTSYDLLMCALYFRAFIADRPDDDAEFVDPSRTPFARGGRTETTRPVAPGLAGAARVGEGRTTLAPTGDNVIGDNVIGDSATGDNVIGDNPSAPAQPVSKEVQ